MEVSSQLHTPVTLPPGKEPLSPIGQEAGWVPELFWTLLYHLFSGISLLNYLWPSFVTTIFKNGIQKVGTIYYLLYSAYGTQEKNMVIFYVIS
jgi:hypothetical protein